MHIHIDDAQAMAEVAPVTRRNFLRTAAGMAAASILTTARGAAPSSPSRARSDMSGGADNFYQSRIVTAQKVVFRNQYRMSIAGNLFVPTRFDRARKHAAIVVGHPLGQ